MLRVRTSNSALVTSYMEEEKLLNISINVLSFCCFAILVCFEALLAKCLFHY